MVFFKDSHNDQYIKEHIIYTEQNAGHIAINAKSPSQTHWNHAEGTYVESEIPTTTLERQSITNLQQNTSDRVYCEKCKGYCQAFIWIEMNYLCVFTDSIYWYLVQTKSGWKSQWKSPLIFDRDRK